jgi:hypothetical protein
MSESSGSEPDHVVSEVRFKDYGTESIEVVDNGSGIAAADYDSVGAHRSGLLNLLC